MQARLGHPDRALRCLELASEDRCPWLGFAIVDPKLDILRGNHGFEELTRKIGLALVHAWTLTPFGFRSGPSRVLPSSTARFKYPPGIVLCQRAT